MAKIFGLQGAMTGKLANTIMAVRSGEQLARKYQPVVYNPNTPGQVAQRAKLKLLSQMSAVMAPVIAIPRRGPVSSRNLFTKVNFPAVSYADDTASATLTNIKLTNGILSLPRVVVTRSQTALAVGLIATTGVDVDRVVYAAFQKNPDGSLLFVESKVVSEPGEGNTYSTSIQINSASNSLVVYAYGVRDNTEAARVTFGNMTALTAETVAKVIVTRVLTESDVTLTETVAVESNPE